MTPGERKHRVMEYVRQRLRKECAAAGRGHQARLARALGTSTAHIANMLKEPPTSNPGEEFRYKVADYWRLTYQELERLATGEPAPTPGSTVPLTREDLRNELEAWERRKALTPEGETPTPGEIRPKKSSSNDG